ncbi:MAG TPA: aminotransferase class IV [Candidatus Polarisedimenticolia bacterium]|nr:aminotransferase class IV [Candidatus Polarisedimenticolia bacterium]
MQSMTHMNDIEIANVNGAVSPAHHAFIPVSDHGFLYGDSVYETVRTYGRRPFLMAAHLDRLVRSAAAIRLPLPWSRERLVREVEATIAAARGPGEVALRIIATRGAGPMGYDPDLCPSPNLVILLRRLTAAGPADQDRGISAIVSTIRRNPIESLDPRIKSSNLLNNILAAQQAKDAGADEALLFNSAGDLAEGTLTNIFFVGGGELRTPSIECGLLSGVTRELVLDLARGDGIPCREGRFRREDLAVADEVLLTSTTREILAVTSLDGRPIGSGRRGPVTARLQELFYGAVERFLKDGGGGGGCPE